MQHTIPGTNLSQSQHLSDEGDSTYEGEGDKYKDKTEGAYLENKSYKEVTSPLTQLLNKYEEGETRFQTLPRMMDSRTYPTTHDPNRKMHLTEGTKDEAKTKQNNILQAKTKEVERVGDGTG